MIWNNLDLEVKQNQFLEKKQRLLKKLLWDLNAQYVREEEWMSSKDVKLLFWLILHRKKISKKEIDFINEYIINILIKNF